MIRDKKTPMKEDLMYTTWDRESFMVMAWLVNAIDEDISFIYMCYLTVKELWDNINQMYSNLKFMNCNCSSMRYDKKETMSPSILMV